MSYPSTNDQDYPRMTPAVQALIAINVAVTFVAYTVWSRTEMAEALAFRFTSIQSHWYTLLTYMFVHADVWHLVGNMFGLFVFGPRLEHMWGTKRFLRFYFLAGFGGLVAHLLFVHDSSMLLGASAAVFGVMGAYALQWPKQEMYFFGVVPMRVWTLVVALAIYNLVLGLYSMSAGGVAYFAHLGGFAVAWFYMRTPQGMSIDQLRQRVSQVPDADDSPPRAIPRTMPRQRERVDEVDEIVAKSKAAVAKRPAVTTPAQKRDSQAERQEAMNRVLDKISAEGMDSLTSDELELLEEMSKRLKKE